MILQDLSSTKNRVPTLGISGAGWALYIGVWKPLGDCGVEGLGSFCNSFALTALQAGQDRTWVRLTLAGFPRSDLFLLGEVGNK